MVTGFSYTPSLTSAVNSFNVLVILVATFTVHWPGVRAAGVTNCTRLGVFGEHFSGGTRTAAPQFPQVERRFLLIRFFCL
jgi:hypothetical protein